MNVAERQARNDEEDFKPRGTVAVVIAYALVTIALWASVYLTLLGRGVTTP